MVVVVEFVGSRLRGGVWRTLGTLSIGRDQDQWYQRQLSYCDMSSQKTEQLGIQHSLDMLENYLSGPVSTTVVSFYHSSKLLHSHFLKHKQDPQLDPTPYHRLIRLFQKYFLNRNLAKLTSTEIESIRATRKNINCWAEIIRPKPPTESVVTFSQAPHSHNPYSHKGSKVSQNVQDYKKLPQKLFPQTQKQIQLIQSVHANVDHLPNPERDKMRRKNTSTSCNQSIINILKHSNADSHPNTITSHQQQPLPTLNQEATKQFLAKYNQTIAQYSQHRLDQAYTYAVQAQQIGDSINLSSPEFKFQREQLSEIMLQYREMLENYKHFDSASWKIDRNENGIKTYVQNEKDNEVGVFTEADLKASMINMVVIGNEVELFDKYMPYVYGCKELKRVSRNTIVGTSKISVPLLADRELFFVATCINRLSVNGSFFTYSKTIHNDKRAQQKYGVQIPSESKCVRLDYDYFIVECFPVDKDKVKMRLASSLNMKLNFMPNFVTVMMAKKFAFEIFMNMLKYEKKFKGSEWAVKKEQKMDVYGYFERILEDYLNKKLTPS